MRTLAETVLGLLVSGACLAGMPEQESWAKAETPRCGASAASQECFNQALLATNPKDQIGWYSKAVANDGKFLEAFVNRGIAHGKNAEFQEAIRDFEKALKIDPADPLPYVNRAYALLLQEDFDGALADYNKAVSLDSKNALIHNSRAYAFYLKGDLSSALKDYDEAIVLNPRESCFYFNRGELKKQMGDTAGAKADWEMGSRQSQAGGKPGANA